MIIGMVRYRPDHADKPVTAEAPGTLRVALHLGDAMALLRGGARLADPPEMPRSPDGRPVTIQVISGRAGGKPSAYITMRPEAVEVTVDLPPLALAQMTAAGGGFGVGVAPVPGLNISVRLYPVDNDDELVAEQRAAGFVQPTTDVNLKPYW